MIFCFDLDNVICKTKKNFYEKSKPSNKTIDIINALYKKGNKIIIFTGRFFGSCNGSIKKILLKDNGLSKKQLKKWKVKYHKLVFGKPVFDVIVDDRNFEFKKNWHTQFKKKYKIKI